MFMSLSPLGELNYSLFLRRFLSGFFFLHSWLLSDLLPPHTEHTCAE